MAVSIQQWNLKLEPRLLIRLLEVSKRELRKRLFQRMTQLAIFVPVTRERKEIRIRTTKAHLYL
jgi:hypothetical protein